MACPTAPAKTIAAYCPQGSGRVLIRTQVTVPAKDVNGRLQLIINARIGLVEVVHSKPAGHVVVLDSRQTGSRNELEQIDSSRRQPRVRNLIVDELCAPYAGVCAGRIHDSRVRIVSLALAAL